MLIPSLRNLGLIYSMAAIQTEYGGKLIEPKLVGVAKAGPARSARGELFDSPASRSWILAVCILAVIFITTRTDLASAGAVRIKLSTLGLFSSTIAPPISLAGNERRSAMSASYQFSREFGRSCSSSTFVNVALGGGSTHELR